MAIVGFVDLEMQQQMHDEALAKADMQALIQKNEFTKAEIAKRKRAAQAYYRQRAARPLKVKLRELIAAK